MAGAGVPLTGFGVGGLMGALPAAATFCISEARVDFGGEVFFSFAAGFAAAAAFAGLAAAALVAAGLAFAFAAGVFVAGFFNAVFFILMDAICAWRVHQ